MRRRICLAIVALIGSLAHLGAQPSQEELAAFVQIDGNITISQLAIEGLQGGEAPAWTFEDNEYGYETVPLHTNGLAGQLRLRFTASYRAMVGVAYLSSEATGRILLDGAAQDAIKPTASSSGGGDIYLPSGYSDEIYDPVKPSQPTYLYYEVEAGEHTLVIECDAA